MNEVFKQFLLNVFMLGGIVALVALGLGALIWWVL